ncbi:MAG: ABC transporter substrate-binding protein [Pseudomonadales bacterium]
MSRYLLYAVLLWSIGSSADPITVLDDVGREVSLAKPAVRVVSLAPHLTEILFELGVGHRVVGTVQYSDYPEAAKSIPRLGDAFSINVEAVLAMAPDIIFAWRTGGSNRALTKLESLGIPVYYNEAPRLEDIGPGIVKIAKLLGQGEVGRQLAAGFDEAFSRLALLHGNHEDRVDPRVFFQISDENLYTVNGEHLIGQAISLCGGSNLFAELKTPVPLVSKEAVVMGRPDLIIITRVPGAPPSSWVEKWQTFEILEGRIASIDPNLISRPGPRMRDGIARVCQLIEEARRSVTGAPGVSR